MSDTPPSPKSPKKPEPSYLSFANPNYCMEGQGQQNDLQSPVDDDDPLSFGRLSVGEGPTTDRRGYANSDYSSGDVTPSSPDRSFILQKLSSPSDEEADTDDDTSSLEDDSEMTHNLLGSQEDVREESTYQPISEATAGGKKSRGILGYLAMLEQQAKGGGVDKRKSEEPSLVPGGDAGEGFEAPSPDELDGGLEVVGDLVSKHKLQNGTDINSPDSHDSGIQSDIRSDKALKHVHGPLTDDIYAIVEKKPAKKEGKTSDTPQNENKEEEPQEKKEDEDSSQEQVLPPTDVLPPGWEKHEDEDGAYYWHIKSGTIQRDPPPPAPPDGPTLCTPTTVRSVSVNSDSSSQEASSVPSTPTSVTSNTERHLQEFEGHALQYAAKSLQTLASQSEQKPPASEEDSSSGGSKRPVRFAVRSLGWVSIAEEDLTPERSSKAVNKCIMDLSLGRNDLNDTVGRWGDGKDLYMDIDSHSLRLLDPVDFSVLNSQPIHSIRVWGVGRDNGRDFAYVARDRATRMHMCHVFQCDTPARQIANTLRDICKRIMQERGLHPPPTEPRVTRPTDLPNLDKAASLINSVTFPTPMEEPRKVIRCHYLGSREVIRPTGTDMINESVDWMYHHVPPEKWTFVNVAIAPSTITITEHGNPDNILEECRVRFMSFMGISISNVKLCAFVMHTAQNKFVAHVFHCEPSAGPLCKTIEAACKLRYQKCLDAHPQTPRSAQNGKRLSQRLKKSVRCVWGSVTQLVSPK
ncbi:protein Fe65 homolog isoform X2 [Babylonia areolata]|uniref:protein Fe65 homolog isoform X2 n=1 Tax=Babylonia areolata TaxID=304850 RepID=UPI003FCFD9F0